MGTTDGTSPAALIGRIRDAPERFEFVQVVRLLRRILPEHSLAFAATMPVDPGGSDGVADALFQRPISEILGMVDRGEDHDLTVIAPVLALAGPMGVLPGFYTEILAREARRVAGADEAEASPDFRNLIELFENRLIQLYYRIIEKTCVPLREEALLHGCLDRDRGAGLAGGRQREPELSEIILSLLGFGTPGLTLDRVTPVLSPLALSGVAPPLMPLNRSAEGFAEIIRAMLGTRTVVADLHGRWRAVLRADGCHLGIAPGSAIGENAILGDRIWDVSSAIRVGLGPIDPILAAALLGGRPDHDPLTAATHTSPLLTQLQRFALFFFNGAVDVRLDIGLEPKACGAVALGWERTPFTPLLGVSTWIESPDAGAIRVCSIWLRRDPRGSAPHPAGASRPRTPLS